MLTHSLFTGDEDNEGSYGLVFERSLSEPEDMSAQGKPASCCLAASGIHWQLFNFPESALPGSLSSGLELMLYLRFQGRDHGDLNTGNEISVGVHCGLP